MFRMNMPLAMGLGILGNQRPTRAPQGFFGSIGPGLAQGMQMYQQAMSQQQAFEMQKQRMDAYKRQVAAQEAKAQQEARMRAEREKLLENIDPKVAQMIRLGLPQWQAEAAGLAPKAPKTYNMFNKRTGSWEDVPADQLTPDHYKSRPKPVLRGSGGGRRHQMFDTKRGGWGFFTEAEINAGEPGQFLKKNPSGSKKRTILRQVTDPDGNPVLGADGQPVTELVSVEDQTEGFGKPGRNAAEKFLIETERLIAGMNQIADDYDPDLMRGPAQVKAWFLDKYDKWVGLDREGDNAEFLTKEQTMRASINQAFNAYRQQITGAAAAMKEIAWLEEAFINRRVSPIAFEARFEQFQTKLANAVRLTKQQLASNPLASRTQVKKLLEKNVEAQGWPEAPPEGRREPSVDTSVFGPQDEPDWTEHIK